MYCTCGSDAIPPGPLLIQLLSVEIHHSSCHRVQSLLSSEQPSPPRTRIVAIYCVFLAALACGLGLLNIQTATKTSQPMQVTPTLVR